MDPRRWEPAKFVLLHGRFQPREPFLHILLSNRRRARELPLTQAAPERTRTQAPPPRPMATLWPLRTQPAPLASHEPACMGSQHGGCVWSCACFDGVYALCATCERHTASCACTWHPFLLRDHPYPPDAHPTHPLEAPTDTYMCRTNESAQDAESRVWSTCLTCACLRPRERAWMPSGLDSRHLHRGFRMDE